MEKSEVLRIPNFGKKLSKNFPRGVYWRIITPRKGALEQHLSEVLHMTMCRIFLSDVSLLAT